MQVQLVGFGDDQQLATMPSSPSVVNNPTNKKVKDCAILIFKYLAVASGFALGLLTGLTVTVGGVSPIGLMIAGGILLGCLVGVLVCGGKKKCLKTLALAVAGFALGLLMGTFGGVISTGHAAFSSGAAKGLEGAALEASYNAAIASTVWLVPLAVSMFFSGLLIRNGLSKK